MREEEEALAKAQVAERADGVDAAFTVLEASKAEAEEFEKACEALEATVEELQAGCLLCSCLRVSS